jgi:hypothetical protein
LANLFKVVVALGSGAAVASSDPSSSTIRDRTDTSKPQKLARSLACSRTRPNGVFAVACDDTYSISNDSVVVFIGTAERFAFWKLPVHGAAARALSMAGNRNHNKVSARINAGDSSAKRVKHFDRSTGDWKTDSGLEGSIPQAAGEFKATADSFALGRRGFFWIASL